MSQSHAVVVGGSIAGMCAAGVLRGRFDRVTIVERDELPDGPGARRGVPQSRHVHALLVRGRRELETTFPGFDVAVRALGAVELDVGTDFVILRPLGWEPRTPTGLSTIWASRDTIEAAVRGRLRAAGGVDILAGARAVGLEVETVSGVPRTRAVVVTDAAGVERRLAADLVVDAAGRGSKTGDWLRAASLSLPEQSVVDSFAAYSSLWIRAPAPAVRARWGGWKGIWIDGDPPQFKRGGVLFPIEGDRCIVTVAGFAHDWPPTEEAGFRDALGTLRSPLLAEVTAGCESLSPVHSSRSMTNRLLHYQSWSTPLAGFVALGDAVCAFNPVYGQGMTTSSVSASILREQLAAHGTDPVRLPRAFFRAQARFLAGPWAMATGADFLFPETVGRRPPLGHLFHPYLVSLMHAALEDETVRRRLGEVFNLLRPASGLLDPRIAARAMFRAVGRARRRADAPRWQPTQPPILVS